MTTDLITVRVQAPAIPEPEGNLDEVQANIDSLLAAYTGRVYTADEIKSAKADRAQVNRWDKQLGEASTALKKHYLAALDKPLARITAMRGQVKEVSAAIDRQVKAVEEAEKEDKRKALELIYRDAAGDDLAPLVPFDRVLDPRWLNKTVTLAAASKELRKGLETHREALRIIRDTCGEDAEACTTEYLRALSLNDALNEYRRRQQAREAQAQAEAARRAQEAVREASPVTLPPTQEEREIRSEAAAAARASAFVTSDGRLDTALMADMAQPEPQAEPERRRYRFWVEFTADDILWFKAAAAERGFKFGSIK